jgi:hypothetical protein
VPDICNSILSVHSSISQSRHPNYLLLLHESTVPGTSIHYLVTTLSLLVVAFTRTGYNLYMETRAHRESSWYLELIF